MSHTVGAKTMLTVPIWVRSQALFAGANSEYRYKLERLWDEQKPTVFWLMMNPSAATEQEDDRTVARCRVFAESWGAGRILVGNTFAYRCTDQKRLLEVADPVGPENDKHLLAMAAQADTIVCAYGKPHPSLRWRGTQVLQMLRDHGYALHCLARSMDGTPKHPLYLKADLRPIPLL